MSRISPSSSLFILQSFLSSLPSCLQFFFSFFSFLLPISLSINFIRTLLRLSLSFSPLDFFFFIVRFFFSFFRFFVFFYLPVTPDHLPSIIISFWYFLFFPMHLSFHLLRYLLPDLSFPSPIPFLLSAPSVIPSTLHIVLSHDITTPKLS